MNAHTTTATHLGRAHCERESDPRRKLQVMFMIRLGTVDDAKDPSPKSALAVARKCRAAIKNGNNAGLKAVFTNSQNELGAHLTRLCAKHKLTTLSDFAETLETIFAAGSDFCPCCGEKSFTEPVLYCNTCGANPGIIFEQAGGPFMDP